MCLFGAKILLRSCQNCPRVVPTMAHVSDFQHGLFITSIILTQSFEDHLVPCGQGGMKGIRAYNILTMTPQKTDNFFRKMPKSGRKCSNPPRFGLFYHYKAQFRHQAMDSKSASEVEDSRGFHGPHFVEEMGLSTFPTSRTHFLVSHSPIRTRNDVHS